MGLSVRSAILASIFLAVFLTTNAWSGGECNPREQAEFQRLARTLGAFQAPTFEEEEARYQIAPPITVGIPGQDLDQVTAKTWKRLSCIPASEQAKNSIGYIGSKFTFFGGYDPAGLQNPAGGVETIRFTPNESSKLTAKIDLASSDGDTEENLVKLRNQTGFSAEDPISGNPRRINLPSDTDLNFDRMLYFQEKMYDPQKNEWYFKTFPDLKNTRMEFRCKIHPGDSSLPQMRLLCQVRYFCWAAEASNPMFIQRESSNEHKPPGCDLNRQTIGYCSYVSPTSQPLLATDAVPEKSNPTVSALPTAGRL